MDLDRSVNEVLGARFGGGGATGQQPIRSQVSEQRRTHCTHSNKEVNHFQCFFISVFSSFV